MDAAPFYHDTLAFRAIPDSLAGAHLEGSECCLIHIDNPLSATAGVWLNPNVRVAYSVDVYDTVNHHGPFPSRSEALRNNVKNWVLRHCSTPWFERLLVSWKVSKWRSKSVANKDDGEICIIDEMQVVVANGWAHV